MDSLSKLEISDSLGSCASINQESLWSPNIQIQTHNNQSLLFQVWQSKRFFDNTKTVAWTSPETLETRIVSKENDAWSFGVVLWEITTNASPYYQEQNTQLLKSKIISSGSTLSKQDMYVFSLIFLFTIFDWCINFL